MSETEGPTDAERAFIAEYLAKKDAVDRERLKRTELAQDAFLRLRASHARLLAAARAYREDAHPEAAIELDAAIFAAEELAK